MDAKITKLRLSRMLSYDWLKMLGLAAALIFVWVLVFTMTATRVLPSQQFIVANYTGNMALTNEYNAHLNGALSNKKLTFEVLETSTADMVTAQDVASQLLQARVSTNELDAIFVSSEGDPNYKYEVEGENGEKEIAYKYTYLDSFLIPYRWNLHKLNLNEDGYFKSMERYLNLYFEEGYENADSLDEAKVEAAFRARCARMEDKRYKKEADIQKGVKGEIERMQKYATALKNFYYYLDAGYVEIVESSYQDEETPEYKWTESYAINICPSGATQKQRENLAKLVGYQTEYVDENGQSKNTVTADNMNICLFNSNGGEEAYRYEGLVYVDYLMESILA